MNAASIGQLDRLVFAFFLLTYQIVQAAATWQVPGDGWALMAMGEEQPRPTFFLNLNDEQTPLQQGDELLTVEGLSVKEILARQFRFFEMRAPDWTEGTVLRYTVRRGGQAGARRATAPVSLGQMLVATLRVLPGQTLIQHLSSFFFFGVGLAVFLLARATAPPTRS